MLIHHLHYKGCCKVLKASPLGIFYFSVHNADRRLCLLLPVTFESSLLLWLLLGHLFVGAIMSLQNILWGSYLLIETSQLVPCSGTGNNVRI